MADNVLEQAQPQTEAVATQDDIKTQLAEQMAISLNLNNPSQQQTQIAEQQTGAATETNQDTNAATTIVEPFSILKEKFQYQSHEDAIKEIEELRAFKANPTTPEFVVPDNESGKILKALAAGKRDEVYKFLDHEMRLERLLNTDLTKDSAADVVKMGMQLKYKDLTPDEINYKFNKQFAIPPKPVQNLEEEESDYQQRVNAWQDLVTDKQMELMIEAKLAKPELQNAKINFDFPEIETPVDEGYIQYKKVVEDQAKLDQEVKEAYKAMTPKNIETKLNFKDEANKINFEFQFEPDAEGFDKARAIVSDADLFWQSFANPDGTPNRQKLLKAIYFANNEEKVLLSAMNQAKNAAIKAQLPDNSQPAFNRQMPQQQEGTELDQQMRIALRGYGGY